jgi:hypothetical protein
MNTDIKIYGLNHNEATFTLIAVKNDRVIKRVRYQFNKDVNPTNYEGFIDYFLPINESELYYLPNLIELSETCVKEILAFVEKYSIYYTKIQQANNITSAVSYDCSVRKGGGSKTFAAIETYSHYLNVVKKCSKK